MPPSDPGASTCTADIFPKEAIAQLNRYADARAGQAEQGGVVLADAKHVRAADVRRSEVVWLEQGPESQPIYGLIAEVVQQMNARVFDLELKSFTEPFQIATYTAAAKGFYGWHVDIGAGRLSNRKLSLVVPLTDPAEYEGGAFEVFHDSEPTRIEMPLGRIVAFPSYLLHRVTPVTRGVRRTMAVWVSGPPFR
ncbi:MAG TPA: 2OG-Fe(II) oxygenase [Caulobacteraceae bacterium]|jgi:PKHD-type hydroxylase|nr:2OG-Fe(II) oxygenase [Caulobacteraceae bacterium]